jgi:CDP-diacylglycerol--glycerol-3-phosphate 3-phosphatidyltransferase
MAMSLTRSIGGAANQLIEVIVRTLVTVGASPNLLTFVGWVINIVAGVLLARGWFWQAGLVVLFAGLFDMLDGRVARLSGRVTQFGGFFDSVLDRYSDLSLLVGLLVYYGSIHRPMYVIVTAAAMTASVMISYTRARAENTIASCKVGFLERPERIVLIVIGALFDRMAPVLWILAVLGNLTVAHRMWHTYRVTSNEPPAKTVAA